jgi:antitoxin ParD1/3/4
MPNVSLTPELDRFAEECVSTGRYASVSEVHRAAMRLLQDAEQKRAAFVASLEEAEDEGERRGFLTAEQVVEDAMSAIKEEAARSRRAAE